MGEFPSDDRFCQQFCYIGMEKLGSTHVTLVNEVSKVSDGVTLVCSIW